MHNHRDDSFGTLVRHVTGRNSHDPCKYSNELDTGLLTQINLTKTIIFSLELQSVMNRPWWQSGLMYNVTVVKCCMVRIRSHVQIPLEAYLHWMIV